MKNQHGVFEALVPSGKEPMLMFIKNQNQPDFVTRFLSAGFYCTTFQQRKNSILSQMIGFTT